MTEAQQEVYATIATRDLYPQPRLQALFDALQERRDAEHELYLKEHAALDDRDITEADRICDLRDDIWKEIGWLEIRIHEALKWVTPVRK